MIRGALSDIFEDDLMNDLFGVSRKYFPVDMVESDTKFTVTADLPGVDKSNINIHHKNHSLIIEAKRECPTGFPGFFSLLERPCGNMRRTVHLPRNIQDSSATADYANGVLTISVDKDPETNPKSIPIKSFD